MEGVVQEKTQLFLTAREDDLLVFNAANKEVLEMVLRRACHTSQKVWLFAKVSALESINDHLLQEVCHLCAAG